MCVTVTKKPELDVIIEKIINYDPIITNNISENLIHKKKFEFFNHFPKIKKKRPLSVMDLIRIMSEYLQKLEKKKIEEIKKFFRRFLLKVKKYIFIIFYRIGRLIFSLIFELSSTVYSFFLYIYQIIYAFFRYIYKFISDSIVLFINLFLTKREHVELEKFLKDEVKKVVKDKIEKIIVPGGVSGCHPINNLSSTCLDLDLEEKREKIKNLLFMVLNVRKNFGARGLRGFKNRENWFVFKKVLDRKLRRFDSRYHNIEYNHYFFERHNQFMEALYKFYKFSLGSTNPFLLLLNPMNILAWTTENLDKALIHLLSQIFIIYFNRDFIKDNITKICTNFLNIVDEILDYENKNYKIRLKNILINIKELLIKVFSFIPLIFYGYILGHLLEPFRVFFLTNQEIEICLNPCPEEIGPEKFYNSKIHIFRFQYYLKILRFNLFLHRIYKHLEKIGILKSTSNYYGGLNIIDKVLSIFASIIAPWRLKDLYGFKNGHYSSNQEIYELLFFIEDDKYYFRDSYNFLKKFIKFFDKDKEDLGIFENQLIERYWDNISEIVRAGLERYGALPGDKFNKITEH